MKNYKIILVTVLALVFTACQAANKASSPTETMRALNEAAIKKDVEATKKLVSKGTLDLLEKAAQNQNTTVDELLRKENGAPFQEMPETRNEKITGDTAIVEIKNKATDEWETLPFVKEDGIWKIALDKLMEEIMNKAREEMNEPPAAGNAAEPQKPESNPAANSKANNKANSN
jgi:hypothetical protein